MEMYTDLLNESSLERHDYFVGTRHGSHDSGVTSSTGRWRQSHVLETYQDAEHNAGDGCNGHFTWGSANEPVPSLADAVNGLREALAAAPERREVDFVQGLAKGTWLPEEDRILVAYVANFGPKQWNNLQAKGLLKRNGKSCRLRWVNQLKPGLQRNMHGKGCKRFTEAEERLVIQLQRTMGNRWAQIAKFLPGRTDNDVKNFWNLHIKRLERAKWQHVSMEQTQMEIKIKMEEGAQLAKEEGEAGAESESTVMGGGGNGEGEKDEKECKREESEGSGSGSETVHKESVKPLLPTLPSPGRLPRGKVQPLLHERRKFRLQEVAAVAADVAGGPSAVTEGVDLDSATLTSLLIGCPQMCSQDINVDDWLRTPTPGASSHAITPWLVQTSPICRPFSPINTSPRGLAAWLDRLGPPGLFPSKSLGPNATSLPPPALFPRRPSNDSSPSTTDTVSEASPRPRGNPLFTPRPSPSAEPELDIHFSPLAIKAEGKKSLYQQALTRGGNLGSRLSNPNRDTGMSVDHPRAFVKSRSFSGLLAPEEGTGGSRSSSVSATHLMLPPLVSQPSGNTLEDLSRSSWQASSAAPTSDWGRLGQLGELWEPVEEYYSPDQYEDLDVNMDVNMGSCKKFFRSISCTLPLTHARSSDGFQGGRPQGLTAGSAGPSGGQVGGPSSTPAGSSLKPRITMPESLTRSTGGTVGDHPSAASCHLQEYPLGGGNWWPPPQHGSFQTQRATPYSAAPHVPPQQQWPSQQVRPVFAPAQIRPKVEIGIAPRAVEYHWGQAKAARERGSAL